MVNVPTGVWVNEEGYMVRPPETAYTSNLELFSLVKVEGKRYVAALRDWVKSGAESQYALTPEELAQRAPARSPDQQLADVHFRVGAHFKENGKPRAAKRHWESAQRLNPDSWNYHRQDWSYSRTDPIFKFLKKVRGLGKKPYYPPLDLDKPKSE